MTNIKSGRVLREENVQHLDAAEAHLAQHAIKSSAMHNAHDRVKRQVSIAAQQMKLAGAVDSKPERDSYAQKALSALGAAKASLAEAQRLHGEIDIHAGRAAKHIGAVRDSAAAAGSDAELGFDAAQRKRLVTVAQLANQFQGLGATLH